MDNLGWHFVGNKLRDGRPIPEDGESLFHTGPLKMCQSGLHLSRRIIDALEYAPGNTICRVEFDDMFFEEMEDKIVASERTILWRINGEKVLRAFSRDCAMLAIQPWKPPKSVEKYLATGIAELQKETFAYAIEMMINTKSLGQTNAAHSVKWAASLHVKACSCAVQAAWASAHALADETGVSFDHIQVAINAKLTNMVEREHQNASSKLV